MILYLVRHGDAQPLSLQGDRGRELTDLGREQSETLGCFLRGLNPDIILISTFMRTQQTLDSIEKESGWEPYTEFVSLDVSPGGDLDDLLIEVKAYGKDSLLIIGHNPQLSKLIYKLTHKDVSMGNCSFAEIDVANGNLVRYLDVEDMHACTN